MHQFSYEHNHNLPASNRILCFVPAPYPLTLLTSVASFSHEVTLLLWSHWRIVSCRQSAGWRGCASLMLPGSPTPSRVARLSHSEAWNPASFRISHILVTLESTSGIATRMNGNELHNACLAYDYDFCKIWAPMPIFEIISTSGCLYSWGVYKCI